MYSGVNASDGIGIGVASVAIEPDLTYKPKKIDDTEAETARYEAARKSFMEMTDRQIANMKAKGLEKEAGILNAHNEFAEDDGIIDSVTMAIAEGMCAEQAVDNAYTMYFDMFSQMEDELFRERAADIADVRTGLLAALLGKELVDLSTLPENSIVVVGELTPSMTADIDKEHVVAIVTETGGRTSHAAIICRAMEIPAVLSVEGATKNIKSGDLVVVDGSKGKVIVKPTDEELETYREAARKFAEDKAALEAFRGKPTVTADGKEVLLVANIGNPSDANAAIEHDCEGVGLFRSEFLFMDSQQLPSEE